MRNDFDYELLKKWFFYNTKCWNCGKNHWDVFHHITGRDSNSILNAAPINNENCHLGNHNELKKKETVKKFLRKTVEYLLDEGYKFNDEDKKFIEKYMKYYKEILKDKNYVRRK